MDSKSLIFSFIGRFVLTVILSSSSWLSSWIPSSNFEPIADNVGWKQNIADNNPLPPLTMKPWGNITLFFFHTTLFSTISNEICPSLLQQSLYAPDLPLEGMFWHGFPSGQCSQLVVAGRGCKRMPSDVVCVYSGLSVPGRAPCSL